MRRDGMANRTRRAALVLYLALGATLLLSACAGSSPASSPGSQPTPAPQSAAATQAPASAKTSAPAAQTTPECPVLTKQEVETALGTSVLNADVLVTEGQLISCSYRDPKSVASILVAVMVQMGSQAKLAFQTRKSNATDPKAVSGLGDDAFWEESANNLEVLKGDNAIVLTIAKGAAPDRPKVAQGLAAKVVDKLPSLASSSAKASASSGQDATLDPCSLLTPEEVESVVGTKVSPVKTTANVGMFSCSYQDTASKSEMASATLFASTPDQAKGIHEATKGGGRDQEAVPGLGEDAYWDKELGGTLYALKGRYAISISVSGLPTKERSKAAQTLAPRLLARLP